MKVGETQILFMYDYLDFQFLFSILIKALFHPTYRKFFNVPRLEQVFQVTDIACRVRNTCYTSVTAIKILCIENFFTKIYL